MQPHYYSPSLPSTSKTLTKTIYFSVESTTKAKSPANNWLISYGHPTPLVLNAAPFSQPSIQLFYHFSDYHNVLQALGRLYPHNFLVLKIQRFPLWHSFLPQISFFCWVPFHVGLPSNDGAAHQPPDINFTLPFRDYFRPLQRSFPTTKQSHWSFHSQPSSDFDLPFHFKYLEE